MNKLTRYNQVLFALLGSLLLIILIFFSIYIIKDEFFNSYSRYSDDTLIVEEKLDSLSLLGLRSQIVSLEGIKLFDSSTNTYLIPVSQKNLVNAESSDKGVLGLADTFIAYGAPYLHYEFGNYNNLILFNFETNRPRILLDERINIDGFQTHQGRYIIITGWKHDTNQDGRLNELDFRSVHIYDHRQASIKELSNEHYQIFGSFYLDRVDKLIFSATDLRDTTSVPEDRAEFLVKYDPSKNNVVPLIEPGILNRLQGIIDK